MDGKNGDQRSKMAAASILEGSVQMGLHRPVQASDFQPSAFRKERETSRLASVKFCQISPENQNCPCISST